MEHIAKFTNYFAGRLANYTVIIDTYIYITFIVCQRSIDRPSLVGEQPVKLIKGGSSCGHKNIFIKCESNDAEARLRFWKRQEGETLQ